MLRSVCLLVWGSDVLMGQALEENARRMPVGRFDPNNSKVGFELQLRVQCEACRKLVSLCCDVRLRTVTEILSTKCCAARNEQVVMVVRSKETRFASKLRVIAKRSRHVIEFVEGTFEGKG